MLRNFILASFFGLCLIVSGLFVAELCTAPAKGPMAARLVLINVELLSGLRPDVLADRQKRAGLIAQRRCIVDFKDTQNDR